MSLSLQDQYDKIYRYCFFKVKNKEIATPSRKDLFLSQLEYPKARPMDFFITQLGYIRKRVWLSSLLLFVGMLIGLHVYRTPVSLVWVISSALPFISLVSICEIIKSITYQMEELEMSCKYNFFYVSLARMGILGLTNLIVVVGILLLFINKIDFGFIRLAIYLTTPFLLNCFGSFYVMNRIKSRETTYICGGITAFVSILNTLLTVQIDVIYTEKYWLLWAVSFVVLAILCGREIKVRIRSMEDMVWNLSLTA